MPNITHFILRELEYEKKGNHVFSFSFFSRSPKRSLEREPMAKLISMRTFHRISRCDVRKVSTFYSYRFAFSHSRNIVKMLFIVIDFHFASFPYMFA